MKILKDILYKLEIDQCIGSTNVPVDALYLNSLELKENGVFIAIKGLVVDGHNFISSAINNGAKVIVCEDLPAEILANIVYVQVSDSKKALAVLASNFYENPSSNIKLIAVTGTNGKTSVATLLFNLYTHLGYKVGLLSTVENRIGNQTIAATHTTPNAIVLNELLSRMVNQSCDYVFMEASSHALHQKRTYNLSFDGAIFTNLSHDHLDYHHTFKEYIYAKKILFDDLSKHAFSLVNIDEKNALVMQQNTKAKKFTYALQADANFTLKILETDFSGMIVDINGKRLHTRLIGNFNAYNLLSVYAAAMLLDADEDEVLVALSKVTGAEGRFEYVVSDLQKVIGIIDYAHTPDALKNVLKTINQIKKNKQKIICVVGCGGDRDAQKRPLMAALAAQMSDQVILTSDNPRTEKPEAIIAQMELGIGQKDTHKTLSIVDREQAIKTACMLANEEDVILIAGKGHEKYQDINGVKHTFDDKEKIQETFKKLGI